MKCRSLHSKNSQNVSVHAYRQFHVRKLNININIGVKQKIYHRKEKYKLSKYV